MENHNYEQEIDLKDLMFAVFHKWRGIILVAVIFIGQQVYEGIAVQNDISNMAHIVGGIVGAVIGYALNKK